MANTYWHKQTADKPLFPELLWSQPEQLKASGKLLIIGGNSHGFASVAEAFSQATKAGIGTVRILLPDVLRKIIGKSLDQSEFAPSTPSGSFGRQALADFMDNSSWADGVLMAGDLGKNSETAILLETFIEKYQGQLSLSGDALDYFVSQPKALLQRPKTLLVPSFEQLQKLAMHADSSTAFTAKLDFLHLVDAMHEFSKGINANIVLIKESTALVASNGQISTTNLVRIPSATKAAAYAGVWCLQNPSKPFEALTTSLVANSSTIDFK